VKVVHETDTEGYVTMVFVNGFKTNVRAANNLSAGNRTL
jgi:hypothetical protein